MIKGKHYPIKQIELIQSVFVAAIVPSVDGNSGTFFLQPNRNFSNVYFSRGNDNLTIDMKDQTANISLQFSSPGLLSANSYELNLAMYRAVIAKVTLCDDTCLIIGDKFNPAQLSYNYDKSAGKYNFSLTWQYHRHPLFLS
jgi:hypothetical protein